MRLRALAMTASCLFAAVMLAPPAAVTLAPPAAGQPAPAPDPAVPPPAGVAPPSPSPGLVPSSPSGYLKTPDGWELTAGAQGETQVAVAPLTTALTSREYVVGGTFTGAVGGEGSTKLTGGSLVVGYRIGCGILGGPVEVLTSVGANPQLDTARILGQVLFPVNNQIKINLRPGTVTLVPVGEKKFKGTEARVTVTGFRVRVDGCVGQSFLQSYSTLTGTTTDTSDIVTYAGQVKVV